jgi:acetyl esterase/lipase
MARRPERYHYGDDEHTFADLHRAAGERTRGTIVLIHGGFWRWNREYFDGPTPMAREFAARGFTVWQVEYRSVGSGGGWPTTLRDIEAAIRRLPEVAEQVGLDLGVMITVGHSAGGHLAVWSLGIGDVPLGGAISLAGVVDLRRAERENLGGGAVREFLGGIPSSQPERYESADPAAHPIAARPVRLIHGTGDLIVPSSQSASYLEAGRSVGQDVTLAEFEGDHFDVIDPAHPSWAITVAAATELTA